MKVMLLRWIMDQIPAAHSPWAERWSLWCGDDYSDLRRLCQWHPHIHSIVADGLFRENGVFYVMPKIDISPLTELFLANVQSMLKKEGLIDDAFITMIMKWRHTSGFSVDNSVCIVRNDEAGITNLAPSYIFNSNANRNGCMTANIIVKYNDTGGYDNTLDLPDAVL